MSTYYLNLGIINRGKGNSVANFANYITGKAVRDCHSGRYDELRREDVRFWDILLPSSSPPEYHDLQDFCDAIEQSERRRDAQLIRYFKAALPNELPTDEQIRIAKQFLLSNFIRQGFGAVVAIHSGTNQDNPLKSNPHMHALVTLRTIDAKGLNPKKDREFYRKSCLRDWREAWARVQNQAYNRNGLATRVDHRSLKEQGIDREPTVRLSYSDWIREKNGERTFAGDQRRAIEARNAERELVRQQEREISR